MHCFGGTGKERWSSGWCQNTGGELRVAQLLCPLHGQSTFSVHEQCIKSIFLSACVCIEAVLLAI